MTEQHRIILRALFYAFGDPHVFAGWLGAAELMEMSDEDPVPMAMLAVLELAWLERESV